MEITDFLSQICDPQVERLSRPFESEGYWCATDAKIAALIRIEDMPLLGYSVGGPKISVLLDVPRPYDISVSLKDFEAQLIPDMIDEVDVSGVKKCTECGGDGEVECDCCGHVHPCDECDGKGEVGARTLTGRKIPDPEKLFQIDEIAFKYRYLAQIPVLAKIMGVNTFRCLNINFIRAAVFIIGNVELFIMPNTASVTGLPEIKLK